MVPVPLLLGLKICLLLCLWVESAVPRAEVVVFSGGSAWNGVASMLSRDGFRCAYILPVTDDGGSTGRSGAFLEDLQMVICARASVCSSRQEHWMLRRPC